MARAAFTIPRMRLGCHYYTRFPNKFLISFPMLYCRSQSEEVQYAIIPPDMQKRVTIAMPPTENSKANARTAFKILRHVKGLREQMQPDEQPLLAIPAIWDSGKGPRSTACEVIVTTRRLMGFYAVSFPRPRRFLEDMPLASMASVSFRHKTYEPLFRELLVSDGQSKVYIRAPRRYIEALYGALRSATEQYAATAQPTFEDIVPEDDTLGTTTTEGAINRAPTTRSPIYGRQDIRTSFSRSPLAITLLFVGGILLEILGALLWGLTESFQIGLPLFVAGLVAVLTATFIRRQKQ